ncbi:NADH:ubiquinone oxidoreductase [Coemansia javaensis]|uniref:NADH:ubiquinone oxidoreductase n=1 Tax=Coemansia javaensis TaxID=2761396 RepID=A0A9W8HE18_9FUNG|nr:NADH:ubiquinone oxidoreductase [Coemansia javaensis]
MSGEEPVSFASPQEEIEYWRNATYALRDQLERKEMEMAEYVAESSELEAELENEIKRVEAANKELRAKNERYKHDIAGLKEKYQAAQLKAGEDLASIERELQFVRSQQEYYKSRTRDLEQDNDDLERNERAAKSSLQVMETRLSRAMEENSQLLGEVETKKMLVDEVQRLKDELKDLNLELNIVRSRNSRAVPQSAGLSKSSANVVDHAGGSGGSGSENPARMVHDIMSRVKDLETRLAGARTKVTPLIGASGQYASRISRGRAVTTPRAPTLLPSSTSSSSATVAATGIFTAGGGGGGGGGSNSGGLGRDSMLPATVAMRARGASRPGGESRIPAGSLIESRMERTRVLRESIRKTLDEATRQQSHQQAVPQRGPVA